METTPDAVAAIKAMIREHKASMKADGIRKTSCFNGGLTVAEYSANKELFALETQLKLAQRNA